MGGGEFNRDHMDHPSSKFKVNLTDLVPYLDDYAMNRHDPFVEDFVWSMDDNRHAESISKELTETDTPRVMLFAEGETSKQ